MLNIFEIVEIRNNEIFIVSSLRKPPLFFNSSTSYFTLNTKSEMKLQYLINSTFDRKKFHIGILPLKRFQLMRFKAAVKCQVTAGGR